MEFNNFYTPLILYKCKEEKINGVIKRTYEEQEMFYGSFKTYLGTETEKDGVIKNIDTAIITTFYNPNITKDKVVKNLLNENFYEIISEIENYQMQNKYFIFKIKKIN